MQILRNIFRILAIGGVIFVVLGVRLVRESRAEVQRAEHLLARSDVDGAIVAYRRAVRLFVPANPYQVEAIEGLSALAHSLEEAGEEERALFAWRSLRGAILSSRSFYIPHRESLQQANLAIAALHAEQDSNSGAASQARQASTDSLRAPSRPHLGLAGLALAGWLLWTFAAFAFAGHGFDEDAKLRPGPARLWGTLILIGLGLSFVGLALA